LLWAVLGFVLLQVGLNQAMKSWLPQWRDPYFGYKFLSLRDRMKASAHTVPSVVMLGSSRTGFGLRGQIAEELLQQQLGVRPIVYNYGIVGAGPNLELICLKRLLAAGIRPDLLLVEVLPPLLGSLELPPMEVHWLPPPRFTLSELKLLERHGFPMDRYRRDWREAWLLPCYGHRFNLVSWVSPQLLPFELRQDWGRGADASGWIPLMALDLTPERYRWNVQQAHREYAELLQGFRFCEPACRALREILEICRHEQIPTALVLMPEGSEFRSWYPPGAWAQIDGFLQELSRTYATPLINARSWVLDEDFSDSHHLMKNGAAVFSERLARDALLPLLRKGSMSRQAHGRPSVGF
jgi:hypothetical protein